MNNYHGIIIEESLEDTGVLKDVSIEATKVVPVTEGSKTPWLKQWTLHTVTIEEAKSATVAEQLSKAIDSKHSGSWYADFRNEQIHYIIFKDKFFKVDRSQPEQYVPVKAYGRSVGIPEPQLDFV